MINAFKSDLLDYRWESNIKGQDINEDFCTYIRDFLQLYNKHFPIKEYRIKEKHAIKPYITSAIKTSIKQRNRLQKLYAKWPLTYEKAFKRYRNMLTSVIRTAKENHYKSTLKENSSNAKGTWKIVNDLLGRKCKVNPVSFISQGEATSDNVSISEGFNEYFCNVANTLAQNIEDTPTSFDSYLPQPVSFSFYLRPTSRHEINSVINNLKMTSPGFDDIHIKVIKACKEEISPFLEYMINKSFSEGCFPDHLQIARVVPVYKKGDNSQFSNYRPISVLPCLSKIFEKIVAIRLLDYLTKMSLLTDDQYGFRPKYSAELAVHHLCKNIYNTLDKRMCQLTVFCDFSKAFDTINHTILLKKLLIYGIRGPSYKWFESYLSNRKQYTMFNNTASSYKHITCGVPQGSILGPLLFLIFINDITLSTDKLRFILFADDTNIFLQDQNLNNLCTTMNRELTHVATWMKSNKLTLNVSKTHYMLSHSNMTQPPRINIKINNSSIQEVQEAKFLGVIIDNKLRWKTHIQDIKCKVSKITGIVYRIRNLCDEPCLKRIYLTLAYPYLLYCSSVWGGAYKTYIDDLFLTQKKLIRIISHNSRYAHTHPIFSKLKLLKLQDIIQYQTAAFVYHSLNTYETDSGFEAMSHNINTRQANHLKLPPCRTSHAQQSVLTRGTKLWNSLPDDIKNTAITKFKLLFKERIRSSY